MKYVGLPSLSKHGLTCYIVIVIYYNVNPRFEIDIRTAARRVS